MKKIEMDAKELFLGLAMVLHSTGSNIKEGKMDFDDARTLYIDILPSISRMVLEEHSDEEMIEAAKKMGEMLTEVAKDQNISIS
ncbi:MAG: hypothetical protein MUP09_04670 [Thiovulaceae bacterium]|nr:hypothetical protein [Sulfurimonadaceae bacterium]